VKQSADRLTHSRPRPRRSGRPRLAADSTHRPGERRVSDFHPGLDIAGDRGQPVYATAAGTISFAGRQGAYGNLIVISHGYGLETRYGHLQSFSVKDHEQVQRGDVIGRVGSTGRSTGNHLHYEVLANGTLLNPLRLLTNQKPRDQ
jgi:murein DD-endopeptidase MepM/ murein hydrolase activator NlpD